VQTSAFTADELLFHQQGHQPFFEMYFLSFFTAYLSFFTAYLSLYYNIWMSNFSELTI